MKPTDALVDEVLTFWFGATGAGFPSPTRIDLWFRATPQHDWDVERHFADAVAAALRGELDLIADTPRGRVALILLLDQFPRHLFRHTPAAFAGDRAALALCLDGCARGDAEALTPAEQLFLHGPLEHAEELVHQQAAVATITAALRRMAPDDADQWRYFARFIQMHHDVFVQFGRFPWRNRILGRANTAAERAYLEHNPPYFGQW